MYLSILKKDLRRKKTMNCILLLFVILSAMFMASSVNNILAVGGGIGSYLDKAGITDMMYITKDNEDGSNDVYEKISSDKSVTEIRREQQMITSSGNHFKDGKKLYDYSNVSYVLDISEGKLNYFDEDNKKIEDIPKGKVLISTGLAAKAELEKGDKITIEIEGIKLELEYAGVFKDAFLGSEMMANYRYVINHDDYMTLASDETVKKNDIGSLLYVNTNDTEALAEATSDADNIFFSGDRAMLETTYMMIMLIAAVVLVASIVLIAIAFVMLRFTISFTVTEEFREIGVMKAVGLKNRSIRLLYLVKYFGISLVGAFIGFLLSIPLSDMLMDSVTGQIVLESSSPILISLICSAAVVLIIMLFCWGCTGKIRKLSPIDAVRNGQTGERFKKRGLLSLSKSRLHTPFFMAANDVLSAPKQFSVMTVIFALCTLLVMVLSTTANSLDNESMVVMLSVVKSDVYLDNAERSLDILYGKKTVDQALGEISDILDKNGMPADVFMETWYKLPVEFDGKKQKVTFLKCKDTKTTDYTYTEGTAPQNIREIAITKQSADKLGAKIGDEVEITIDGRKDKYLITAYFQGFNNLGECARLYQDVEINDSNITSLFSFQINFKDDPDKKTIDERIQKLKDIFETENVLDARGFVNDCTGVSGTISDVKNMLLVMSIVIIIMISVLMERSFISKEKSEIALLKALGFKNKSIYLIHTLRFVIVALVSVLIAAVVSTPITHLTMDPVFAMMGVISDIPYEINYIEVILIIPAVVALSTVAGAGLTALYSRKIKAYDTANNE
ncbi:MAG: ABC transporter permease [Ruminococcus sp.]|nr:ABC transporter permease [Ruminococcus sp.]